MIKITAVIITFNEALHIYDCLKSLDFVDQIVVVDSGSTDETRDIVKVSFPHAHLIETKWYGYAKNKKIGIESSKNSWILWIDADERVPEALRVEMVRLSEEDLQGVGGVQFPRQNFFLRRWVKYSGWYPNWCLRLFHRDRSALNDKELHEGVEVFSEYKTVSLSIPLLHYSYETLGQYFDKMKTYGENGALALKKKGRLVTPLHLLVAPCWTFVRDYFLRKGFLDGVPGLIVCIGAAFSTFIKYAYAITQERDA